MASSTSRRTPRPDVAGIPEKAGGQGVYLITYTVGGREYKNTTSTGPLLSSLGEYREWMEKTGIYDL